MVDVFDDLLYLFASFAVEGIQSSLHEDVVDRDSSVVRDFELEQLCLFKVFFGILRQSQVQQDPLANVVIFLDELDRVD